MVTESNAKNSRYAAFAVLFVVVISAAVGYMLSPPAAMQLLDFPEFYTAGRLALEGHAADVYSIPSLQAAQWQDFPAFKESSRFVALFLPPTSLLFLSLVALAPVSLASWLWWCASLASAVAATLIFSRLSGLSERAFVRVGALLTAFGPGWETLKHGQIGTFLLLTLALAAWFVRKGNVLAGAAGLAICLLKPQLVLTLLAFLTGAKQFKLIAYVVLGYVCLSLISVLLFGPQAFMAYSDLMANSLQNRQLMAPEAGPSLRGQLLRLWPNGDSGILVVSTVVLLIALLFSCWWGWKQTDKNAMEAGLLSAIPLGLWTAMHLHAYDAIFLLPSVVVALRTEALKQLHIAEKVLLGLCLAMFFMPFYNKLQYEYILCGGLINPFFVALVVLSIYGIRLSASHSRAQE